MMPRTCSACGAPIRWARTVNDRYIPLDQHPDPAGNQAAYYDATTTLRTRQLRKDEKPLAYERVYMPHAATCTVQQRRPQAPVPAAALLPPNVTPITAAPSLRRGRTPSKPPAPRRGA